MEKDVTVIIPSYNRAHLLEKTIPSYIQPEVDELILVDDCSTDATKNVVEELQKKYPQIRYIRNEKNSKQTFSKNSGIKNASTEYVYFGDDDSVLAEGSIKNLLNVVKSGKADVAGARAIYMGNYCGVSKKDIKAFDNWCSVKKLVDSKHIASFEPFESHFDCRLADSERAEMAVVPFLPACILCKREDAAAILFDTNYAGSAYREETDFCVGLLRLGKKLAYVPDAVQINFPARLSRGGAHSDGKSAWLKSSLECNKYFFEKNWDFLREKFGLKKSLDEVISETEKQIKSGVKKDDSKLVSLLKRLYWKFVLLKKYGE